jgi:hypothetical protein
MVPLAVDRRTLPDRRQNRLRTLMCSFYMGRRRRLRRPTRADYYLDVIERRVIVAAVAILLLSCADIVFTLTLLQRGANEVNPLMRYLIELDSTLFIWVKLSITAAGVLFLAVHNHFRFLKLLRGRHALYLMVGVYAALVNYQITLLS